MPERHSITSSPSFAARRLRAERWRIVMLGSCVVVAGLVMIVRRQLGGADAAANPVFYGTLSIVGVSVAALTWSYLHVLRLMREERALSSAFQIGAFLFDLIVPFAAMAFLHYSSPRGHYAALSAPVMILVPIVIMLSVLKLRPRESLLLGVTAALGHWAIVVHTVITDDIDVQLWPMLLTYGVYFAMSGGAAALLAGVVRDYIREAVGEAQAAERAQLKLATVENELEIARSIQLGLLPAGSPEFPGFDIAGRSEPASHAGGDYYDWQMLPDGRLVVGIADVTGHGIGPALVMAVCRAYARATAPTSAGAEDFLHRLNGLISGDVTGGRFITMAVGLVEKTGDIDLLSAGHGPSFVYSARTGQVEHYGGDGLPLGIFAEESYSPIRRVRLESGDVLVLITDGFMEQHSPSDEQFGIPRLHETIRRHAGGPAKGLIDALYTDVRTFAATAAQNDDMTVVVMKRL
jgi:serine phosphatase RsbU (regulator of sigma subunit)